MLWGFQKYDMESAESRYLTDGLGVLCRVAGLGAEPVLMGANHANLPVPSVQEMHVYHARLEPCHAARSGPLPTLSEAQGQNVL